MEILKMSNGKPFSIISDSETLTLQHFAARCGESEQWVIDHFIYPTDPKTHKPLFDENGDPELGCPVLRKGRQKCIVGASFNAWAAAKAAPLPRPQASKANARKDDHAKEEDDE